MNVPLRPLRWAILTIVLSALISFLVARSVCPQAASSLREDPALQGDTFHNWLHAQLLFSPEQEAAFAPLESAYIEQHTILQEQVRESGNRLADALNETEIDDSKITSALLEIHEAQAQLQRLAIQHFLEMKKHLSPDQAQKLLQWTRESITHEQRP